MCLSEVGLGRIYRLHAQRPGASTNRRIVGPARNVQAGLPAVTAAEPAGAKLVRVDISGPVEQRAGYHDICGGWSDGNDAIAERLCAAFAEGDVQLVGDTPGGAAAGAQQGIAKALAAKAKYGRRCTGWANEMIASLGMWWALALCDELFIPRAGQLGSIGARAGHLSVAGALAKAGEEVTYFTWPGPGKIAFAPEFALSEIGKQRGERDVALIGEAFCEAVISSIIGQRNALDRDRVVALGADVLTGQAAVDAGLADGVASEEEVTAYALQMAERGAAKSSSAQTRARGGTMKHGRGAPGARAEEDEDEARAKDDDAPPSSKPGTSESEPGRSIPTACAKCNVENPVSAKFCMGCGASLATESSDDAPPSSKPGASAARVPARSGGSLAEILGLPADASLPAQKSRALELREVFDAAAKHTDEKDSAGIVGGLSALSRDAAASGRYRRERNELRAQQDVATRADFCKRLVACGGAKRGDVYLDEVAEGGQRRLDESGQPIVHLAPQYAEMKLATLRGLVVNHEKNAPPRNPFEPSREAAETASKDARKGGDKAARIERAKKHPIVLTAASRPGQTLTVDQLAAAFVAADQDLTS